MSGASLATCRQTRPGRGGPQHPLLGNVAEASELARGWPGAAAPSGAGWHRAASAPALRLRMPPQFEGSPVLRRRADRAQLLHAVHLRHGMVTSAARQRPTRSRARLCDTARSGERPRSQPANRFDRGLATIFAPLQENPMPQSTYDNIVYEVDRGRARITLDRPEVLLPSAVPAS